MNNEAKIVQTLMHRTNDFKLLKECGWGPHNYDLTIVIALYDDQTWERIAVSYGSFFANNRGGHHIQLPYKLRGKTRNEASQILDDIIAKYEVNGKNLIKGKL